MTFRIRGLSPEPFRPLVPLSDADLVEHLARRYLATPGSAMPCRVSLVDAEPGERVLLANYQHQPAQSPYRASHAVFVREAADAAYDRIDEIPPSLRTRLLSVRAFDAEGMMVAADVVEGAALGPLIVRMFDDPLVAMLQAHYAKAGCFAASVSRA